MNSIPPQILAIEDAAGTIQEVAADLKDAGINIDYAESVSQAERKLSDVIYDILIVDVMIKDSDETLAEQGGVELIRRLRSGELGKKNLNTPFFILTGQKPSLDEGAIHLISGCLGIEKKLLQHRLVAKIKRELDEAKAGG
jgi:DNA-binding response OmpR family regulator